jgi:FMN phosphatase YigB (HAD superfamily)
MIKALITDFSRVLLFPKNKNYKDSLNTLHKQLSTQSGYRLLDHFELNNELLDYYKSLGDKLDIFLFTSETIQDSPELTPFVQPIFKAVYSALKMGVSKKDEEAYHKLSSMTGFAPDDSIYVDDSEINITTAKKAGFQTILYKNNESLKNKVREQIV